MRIFPFLLPLFMILVGCTNGAAPEPAEETPSKQEDPVSEMLHVDDSMVYRSEISAELETVPAVEVGEEYEAAASGADVSIDGTPLLWVGPDKKRVVLDARHFTDLSIVDAPRLEAGERVEIGRFKSSDAMKGSDLARFLIRTGLIQTFWHIESNLKVTEESENEDRYRGTFEGTHLYFTNERNESPVAFTLELDKKSGTIAVTGK